ncbi:MAG: PEGA domain-containing protein [Sedimentisphaerales bacterium]|nr:PEGA domain-containing protein [Sedimentisphaerales bacterium]
MSENKSRTLDVRLSSVVALFILLAGLLPVAGCVERKLTISTNPSGALVVLNDEEIGVSPATVSFNWYGDYNVTIRKQGYVTLQTHRKLQPPLHDCFPFDFFAEILSPGRIVDAYQWSFDLAPQKEMDRQDLIQAAEQLKQKTED